MKYTLHHLFNDLFLLCCYGIYFRFFVYIMLIIEVTAVRGNPSHTFVKYEVIFKHAIIAEFLFVRTAPSG